MTRTPLCLLSLALPALALGPAPARAAAPETVRVPALGGSVATQAPLDAGALYLLRATGTVRVGRTPVDAEGAGTGPPALRVLTGAAPSPGPSPWFGPPRPDHAYAMLVTGAGRPLTLKLVTPGGAGGRGALTVSVFRLSPAPPALSAPLETLQVPVQQQISTTKLTARAGTVYLLQCAGQGRVGGGGLGMGDAEYMDYRADGAGAEDIGDANTDYGMGVDEADQGVTPRARKWGAWRADHTYYMLYAGTGAPIHFMFYDVKGGYGDNSPTDTLTVRVFALP